MSTLNNISPTQLLRVIGTRLPALSATHLQDTDRWVTRHRPKIDRIACAWLVLRFINPDAQIMSVPPAVVPGVAERFSAILFNVAGVTLTHRGDSCTSDTIIADFKLSRPALDLLAAVVRATDTNQHQACPQAAGLVALSVGLSGMHKDDNQQLGAALPLCDALFRWTRDGFVENHKSTLNSRADA
ncbi:hypothetical protein SAMN04488515_1155 [Cognatiyoonia koreensis]|uniref:ChrB C-terminal domain-containing protein n=1 Tax=Cognatiyoonia koreensis TaxID=364200 RepID=A0A1I0PCE1_9RHOB|nr:chromate resistance protein ChrB domain-containing protein [Cognatiyoonia koreensis]SEW12085.1 hypothetical protein SAMN04488515_1155 [Cognatiyoonia koreensis]